MPKIRFDYLGRKLKFHYSFWMGIYPN